MNTDQISIILEVLSFFLVTLDLFGKDRLSNLYQRILSVLHQGYKLKILGKFEFLITKSWIVIYILSIITYVGVIHIVVNYGENISGMFPKTGSGRLLAFLFIVFSTTLITWALIYFLIFLIDFIVNVILGGFVKLLHKYELDGIMLTVGTILFLISKIISFKHAGS